MGFTPRAIGAMSLYEFAACADGWNAANGAEEALDAPSPDEFHAMVERMG